MRYLKDDESRSFATKEELKEYFEFRKENDLWVEPYIKELTLVGIPDNPLLLSDEISAHNIANEDSALECIKDLGVFCTLPVNGYSTTLPTRGMTAFQSFLRRAGLSGRTLSNFKDNNAARAMGLEMKVAFVNEALAVQNNTCKVLYRDEKIHVALSHMYNPLPVWELNTVVEEQLKKDHPDYEFCSAQVTHEYIMVDYDVCDLDAEEFIYGKFMEFGHPCDSIRCGISFITSDIGMSGAKLLPYILVDDTNKVYFTEPEGILHRTGNSLEDFRKKAESAGTSFKECEDNIEILGNTVVNNVPLCVRNIAEQNAMFPKDQTEEVINDLIGTVSAGTAMDVYLALVNIAEKAQKAKGDNLNGYLKAMEKVGKYLYHPEEWVNTYDI